jgi:hypothetical protein
MLTLQLLAFVLLAAYTCAQPPAIALPLTFGPDYYDSSRDSCPFMTASLFASCNSASKYRTFDGSCNNVERPWVGMAGTPFKRYMPSNYSDGVSALRGSSSGSSVSLPNERALSSVFCGDNSAEDTRWTNFMPIFGQFVAHDVTALAPTLGFLDYTHLNMYQIFISILYAFQN